MVKRAFVFPGQGTQIKQEDVQFLLKFLPVDNLIDKSSVILNLDMRELLSRGVPPSDTRLGQIVTYVLSLSLFYLLETEGIFPDVVAGHSLGEFSALTSCGSISIEDGLELVKYRGEIMADACKEIDGGMLAVIGLDETTVCEVIKDITDVEAVNFNSPRQVVISGKSHALASAEKLLKEKGAKRIIPLDVAGPFHSSLLKNYGEMFYNKFIRDLLIKKPERGFVSSVNGRLIQEEEEIKGCLRVQMYSPVRWTDVIKTLEDLGCGEVIEVGPGNVLTGLIKQTSSRLVTLDNALEILRKRYG
ncbi:TPA: acyltransferase domain-containing protein [bacterium]|nr:acyltransferase domain-containing protein [bacterium]